MSSSWFCSLLTVFVAGPLTDAGNEEVARVVVPQGAGQEVCAVLVAAPVVGLTACPVVVSRGAPVNMDKHPLRVKVVAAEPDGTAAKF